MKPILHPRDAVELFQGHFLAQLDKKIPETAYAVKGGCNLRLMLGSPRASEDLDLDIHQVAKHTLQKNVDGMKTILEKAVANQNVTIIGFSAPKQTETVQRWKIELDVVGQRISTKVEFLRRGIDGKPNRTPLPEEFREDYQIQKTMLSHYGPDTALLQKVRALAGRPITQARDVFDAAFLIGIGATPPKELSAKIIETAQSNLGQVTYNHYLGQVVPYLTETDAKKFEEESVWVSLKETIERLLGAIPMSKDSPEPSNPKTPNEPA